MRACVAVTPCFILIQLMCSRCLFIAGLAQAWAFSSVSSTKMWRCTPIAMPPGNSGFGCAGLLPRLAKAFLKVSIFALAEGLGPSVTKCRPSSPAQVEPSSPEEPYQNGGDGVLFGGSAIGAVADSLVGAPWRGAARSRPP